MFRHTFFLLALCLVTGSAWAQMTPAPIGAAPPEPRPFFSRISGIFNGDLPQLDLPDTVKVILRPHFGDLFRRDYMQVETGLRYALNNHFELSTEASVFFTHCFGDSAGYGMGKIRFGSKYVFEHWPRPDFESSFALNVDVPTGHPPVDMTDGHFHFSPSYVLQFHSRRNPHLTTFGGVGLDFIRDSHVQGTFGRNQPHDNSFSITGGGIYDLGQLKWTFSATYATTSVLSNRPEQFFSVQPGLLWYVPSKFTFHSKTQWIVGLTARSAWGPDGTEFSLGSRLRAEITFRQVMAKLRARNGSTP